MTSRHAFAVFALLLPAPLAAQDIAVAVTRSVVAEGTTTLVHEATVPARHRVTSVIELKPLTSGTRVRLTAVGFAASEDGAMLADFFAAGNATTLKHLRQRFISGPRNWSVEAP